MSVLSNGSRKSKMESVSSKSSSSGSSDSDSDSSEDQEEITDTIFEDLNRDIDSASKLKNSKSDPKSALIPKSNQSKTISVK